MNLILSKINFKCLLASISATFTFEVLTKYFISDIEFVKWLVILMVLDLITGLTKAVNNKKAVTSIGLRQTVTKTVQYFSLIILVHVLTNMSINNVKLNAFDWLNHVTYIYLIIIEALSILENISGKSLNLTFIIEKLKSMKDGIK